MMSITAPGGISLARQAKKCALWTGANPEAYIGVSPLFTAAESSPAAATFLSAEKNNDIDLFYNEIDGLSMKFFVIFNKLLSQFLHTIFPETA
jgi:hypothetical protein